MKLGLFREQLAKAVRRDLKKHVKYKQHAATSKGIPSFDDLWEELKDEASEGISYEVEHFDTDVNKRKFKSKTGKYPDDYPDDYEEWLIETIIKDNLRQTYDNTIDDYVHANGHKCWRMISLRDHIQPEKHPSLGTYWSIDQDAVDVYWTEGKGRRITYEGRIDKNSIDWRGTMLARLNPSTGEAEQEIRFLPHSPIFIYRVHYDGKWHDVNAMRRC